MDAEIIYNKSAFRHGLVEADIEWAFLHPIRNGLLEDYENKYLLIGFDTHGNPIEVMYNRIDEDRVNVFHAINNPAASFEPKVRNLQFGGVCCFGKVFASRFDTLLTAPRAGYQTPRIQ